MVKRNLLFITQNDNTGADKALIKAAEYLFEIGHNVQILVHKKTGNNSLVTELKNPEINYEISEYLNKEGSLEKLDCDSKYLFFSINEKGNYLSPQKLINSLRFRPNIIFVGSNPLFLRTQDIIELAKYSKAIVYNVAVDMNHFTGGCHFAWDCNGFTQAGCKDCPAIIDDNKKNIASRNFNIKKEAKEKFNFRVLAGTEWTKKQAEKSIIYQDQSWMPNISGVIDSDIYNTKCKSIGRQFFNFEKDKFYILTGSENSLDVRKGYKYFIEAINILWDRMPESDKKKVIVLSVGKVDNYFSNKKIPFKRKHIDYIYDERLLAQLYKASDVFVSCSIEDSGPSMLLENMACGTPVVSFNVGAAPEFIEGGVTGFIAEVKNSIEIAEGIMKVFNLSKRKVRSLGLRASKRVMETASKESALKTFDKIFEYHHAELELYRDIGLSVALCTYNGEAFLKEQLDSILNQKLQVNEIVVCDDNSKDRTWDILKEYQLNYPKTFKIYQNNSNLGVVKNFEKAINLCSQEIIFLCDQDDVWYKNKTERVVSAFKTQKGINAVCHDLDICDERKIKINQTMWETVGFKNFLENHYGKIDNLEYALYLGNMVTGAGFAFRKNKNIKLVDGLKNVIHDYQLGLYFIRKKSIYYLNESLGVYRQHENQQIGAVKENIEINNLMVDEYFKEDNTLWKNKFIKSRINNEEVFKFLNKKNYNDIYNKYILKNNFLTKDENHLKAFMLLCNKINIKGVVSLLIDEYRKRKNVV